MELTNLVWDNREDPMNLPEFRCLIGSEVGREAIDCSSIGIENLGGVRGRRKGSDDGGVPVMVGEEERGLV